MWTDSTGVFSQYQRNREAYRGGEPAAGSAAIWADDLTTPFLAREQLASLQTVNYNTPLYPTPLSKIGQELV